MAAPDSFEDKFAAKKRAELEAEKAAISGLFLNKKKRNSFSIDAYFFTLIAVT